MKRTTAPGATVDNKYTDGDPSLGIIATDVRAEELNHIQEEISQVIEGFGVNLNPAEMNQLFTVLLAEFVTKSNVGHNHNSEYYLQSQVNTLLADKASRISPQTFTGLQTFSDGVNVIDGPLMHFGSSVVTLSAFASNVANSGFQQFPGGLIVQWGSYVFPSNPGGIGSSAVLGAVPFPITFPNNFFIANVDASGIGSTGIEHIENYLSVNSASLSQLTVAATRTAGAYAAGELLAAEWLAFGN